MAGPWEKYKTAQASGPWAKFQQTAEAPSVDEVSSVGFADRAIAKNFGNSPESQAAFIKQQYPGAQVKVVDGEVEVQMPGETAFKRLDPSFSPLKQPMETLRDLPADIADVAYDVGAGALQGLATVKGAVLGSALPVAGTLAGGAAASSASGAVLEALRQKLGQKLGIPQEVDKSQVGFSAATGFASPLLFGAGKAAGQAGRGLIERGYDGFKQKVAPKVGELMSGVKADVIRAYADKVDEVDELERNGVMGFTQQMTDKIGNTLGAAKDKAGKAVGEAMENANTPVNVTAAKKQFLDRINLLMAKTDKTPADVAELNSLKSTYQKYFGLDSPIESFDNVTFKKTVQSEVPDQLDASRAFDLQKKLKKAADFEGDLTPENLAVRGSARGAYGKLNEGFDEATGGLSTEAKQQYQKHMQIENEIGTSFDTPQKTYNTVTGLDAKGRKMLGERLKQLSDEGKLDIDDEIKTLQAYNAFADPSMVPVGLKGATSTSRSIPLSIAGGSVGTLLGYKLGGGYAGAAVGGAAGAKLGNVVGSPATVKKAIKATRALEAAGRAMQPDAGYGAYLAPAGAQVSPWMFYQPEPSE
jgi:hypothetical protein